MDSDQIFDSNQNKSIKLNCSMEANPPAEYKWFKDGFVTRTLNLFAINELHNIWINLQNRNC